MKKKFIKKRNVLLILFIIFIQSYCKCQIKVDYAVIFDTTTHVVEDETREQMRIYYMTKDNSRVIEFGKYYDKSKITIIKNDSIDLETIISTNFSIEKCNIVYQFKIGNKNQIKFICNNEYFIFDYCEKYLFLRIDYKEGKFILTYHHYPDFAK